MVELYVKAIKNGLKTINDVPPIIRAKVEQALSEAV